MSIVFLRDRGGGGGGGVEIPDFLRDAIKVWPLIKIDFVTFVCVILRVNPLASIKILNNYL